MKKADKRTLREEWRLISRAIKIIWSMNPGRMIFPVICTICDRISPYFSLYMSALLVNELAGECDMRRLLTLAAITVFGLFAISLISRLLRGRNQILVDMWWHDNEIFFMNAANGLQYEHIENSDVHLMRENIFAAANATGQGLNIITWALPNAIAECIEIVLSAILTFSMFTMTAKGGFTGFAAFINSPYSAVTLAIIMLVCMVVSIRLRNSLVDKNNKARADLAQHNMWLRCYNGMSGMDVTVMNMKKIIMREWEKFQLYPEWAKACEKLDIRYGILFTLLNAFKNLLLFIYVAAKAFIGVFGIGSFILYRGTVSRFFDAVSGLMFNIGYLRHNNKYLQNIYDYLDLPDDMYKGTLAVEKREDIDYEIEFRDVSFKYPRTENWALRHVNMKFKIGTKLAIVGENGSGKTTLIKLLCRLYDPTEGTILLNGIDITRYRYNEYLALFSVVFQDYRLFEFSIASNVAASFDIDRERVEDCLRRADFGDRLDTLEKGIDTAIGRSYEVDGIDLSGGETQKIALARALYKNAPFVILDEPTAALDPIAEAAVYENFNNVVKNRTAVYISHRLSSCRFCDEVAVFHKGELVQRGSHEELVKDENGKYCELWNAQAKYYT